MTRSLMGRCCCARLSSFFAMTLASFHTGSRTVSASACVRPFLGACWLRWSRSQRYMSHRWSTKGARATESAASMMAGTTTMAFSWPRSLALALCTLEPIGADFANPFMFSEDADRPCGVTRRPCDTPGGMATVMRNLAESPEGEENCSPRMPGGLWAKNGGLTERHDAELKRRCADAVPS